METRLVKKNAVASCLSCSICLGLLNEATTVSVCLHTFCKSCITKKIVEEDISNCPQCNTYLGGDPLEKLRMDNSLQKIRATLFPLNSYKPEVHDKSKLTCQSALSANAAPKSNAKKGKLSSGSMHFFESGTVKNQLISHIQQVKEIEPRDHQNHSDVPVTGQGDDYRSCSSGPSPIWFSLISSTEENGSPPLPQIPLCYLNTKNGNAPVQLVKKYLVRKLNLSSEAEVEITLIGEVLGDHCCLKDLLQLWLRTRPQGKRIGQDSAKDAVMPLVYSRKA
uniref:RING-type domain-containing protein n=1 Tax=Kalanchoe fedtschenkoi TaxID=63787 RepID=A0A7N0USZ6_KALFE